MTKVRGTRDPRRDVIADALRTAIISGRLTAGERLVEDAIAEEYGVSRVPVREALNRLESEGFVTLTPFRGASVSATSRQDSIELMQVRRGLEVLAAKLAAEVRGGEVRDQLAAIVEQGKRTSHEQRFDELPALIIRFHELVAEATGNRKLQEMLQRLLEQIAWGFQLGMKDRFERSWDDHAAIAMAILGGAPVQAGYLMDEHIAKDEILYLEAVDHRSVS